MTWWLWMVMGAIILGAELFAIDAQFYLVFMGISAALVGLAGLLGISLPEWAQWTAFATLSLLSFFTFRKSLYQKIHGGVVGFRENLSGDSVNVGDAIEPGGEARVSHRGSKWTARNTGQSVIAAGARARVVKVDGLTLHVEAE
ncbi:MAG: NfeD family protein [Gammaproteobacteria bacterium]|nr:NfeD family protein [Gammaproteobacteria bacterium]